MKNREELLIRVSELYYEQNLNQSEIAKILEVSRPTVSRLIDEAKEAGIVEIIVHSPVQKNHHLSRLVRNTFHLQDAIVLRGNYDYQKSLHRCCEEAVRFFNTIMDNNMTIGISWGIAPQYLCEIMEPHEYYNVHVVQMLGCLGTGNPNVDGIELAMRMSKLLGGTYSSIYAPIYVGNETLYSYLINEPQIKRTLNRAEHLDIFLTGIGSLDPSTTLLQAEHFSDEARQELIKIGAAGHLLARPYDINGNPIPVKGRYTIGAPLEVSRNIPWSVGITAAVFKAQATLGAIRGGYINVLITDEPLAEEILRLVGCTEEPAQPS